MNGNICVAPCASSPLFFAVAAAVLLCAACDNPPLDHADETLHALAMPGEMQVVYGPVNDENPFEETGVRHNELVHAVLMSAQSWDTLDIEAMLAHIRGSIPPWAEAALGVPFDRSEIHVATAFALRIDSTARHQLASFNAEGYSHREIRYIRRIGELLRKVCTFPELERDLLALEEEILSEEWPSDLPAEPAARTAISIAKHSAAYWKHVFCLAAGIDPVTLTRIAGAEGSIGKPAELLVRATTRSQIVMAADVISGVTAAEHATPLGPMRQLEAAIISGGAVSIIVATIVYFDEIINFFSSIGDWLSNR
ncbi:MAG: hypothetical protein KFH87_14000 [Bacteroidetes bacterium]|nr:hypothetical protein [Bacteroidota bacterium]